MDPKEKKAILAECAKHLYGDELGRNYVHLHALEEILNAHVEDEETVGLKQDLAYYKKVLAESNKIVTIWYKRYCEALIRKPVDLHKCYEHYYPSTAGHVCRETDAEITKLMIDKYLNACIVDGMRYVEIPKDIRKLLDWLKEGE